MIRIIIFTIVFTAVLYLTSFFPEWAAPAMFGLFALTAMAGNEDATLGKSISDSEKETDFWSLFYRWTGAAISLLVTASVIAAYYATNGASVWGVVILSFLTVIVGYYVGYKRGMRNPMQKEDGMDDYLKLHRAP